MEIELTQQQIDDVVHKFKENGYCVRWSVSRTDCEPGGKEESPFASFVGPEAERLSSQYAKFMDTIYGGENVRYFASASNGRIARHGKIVELKANENA